MSDVTILKYLCNASAIIGIYLCSRFHNINITVIMNKEKAIRIQRYYDYFRLIMILSLAGLLVYLAG